MSPGAIKDRRIDAALDSIQAQRCVNSLAYFTRRAWPIIQPGRELFWNWHLDLICEHLEAVSAGELHRLIINVPPRSMKSLLTSVFWPAWEWLSRPEVQWLFTSHTAGLATRDATRTRRLMDTPGLREPGPRAPLLARIGYRGLLEVAGNPWDFTSDENLKTRYSNSRNGYRISTGIGGGATGEGGDRLVCDDPHKLEEADSEAKREAAVDFVTETLPSRANTADAATVVIQQRVHEGDVTGILLEQGGWTHLCLPMEYSLEHPFRHPRDVRSEDGELLFPKRFPPQWVRREKASRGSYKWAGQYQQLPAPEEGGILKRRWWQFYEPYQWPQLSSIVVSWDMAFKDEADSDFVAGGAWGVDGARRYLLAMIRARLSFTHTLMAVEALTDWCAAQGFSPAHAKLVEDKANGTAVINALRRTVAGLIAVEPQGGKIARARAIEPQVEAGNVFIPRGVIPAPEPELDEESGGELWSATPSDVYVDELVTFPFGLNDDQVDMTSQALIRLSRRDGAGRVPRHGTADPSPQRPPSRPAKKASAGTRLPRSG